MFQHAFKKYRNQVLTALSFGVLLLSSQSAFAATTAVDDLKTEADKLDDVYAAVVPMAVASIVFSIGAMLIKRIAFA